MKKLSMWMVALVTALVSLGAMCLFDFLLSLVYYYLGKVPFLTEIIDFIGEILDLGLTVLVAYTVVLAIWTFGHSLIEKINGEPIEFKNSPIRSVNLLFLVPFFAMLLVLGYQFITLIGGAVTAYTTEFQGLTKVLMFFKSIKDTLVFVCNENIILYKIGANSLLLSAMNLFADSFV